MSSERLLFCCLALSACFATEVRIQLYELRAISLPVHTWRLGVCTTKSARQLARLAVNCATITIHLNRIAKIRVRVHAGRCSCRNGRSRRGRCCCPTELTIQAVVSTRTRASIITGPKRGRSTSATIETWIAEASVRELAEVAIVTRWTDAVVTC